MTSLGKLSFLSLILIVITTSLQAKTEIVWKKTHPAKISFASEINTPLKLTLNRFIEKFAENPHHFLIDSKISSSTEIKEINGRNLDNMFHFLLSRHNLKLISNQKNHKIVSQKDYWRHKPYRKTSNKNISLNQLLLELSRVGEVTIRFNPAEIENRQIQHSLNYHSIKDAVFDLAVRQNAVVIYYPEIHILEWIQDPPLITRTVILDSVTPSEVQEFLEKLRADFEELNLVHVAYPTNTTVILRGTESTVLMTSELIENWQLSLVQSDEITEATEAEETPETAVVTETEKLTHIESDIFFNPKVETMDFEIDPIPEPDESSELFMKRLKLNYLNVGTQTIQSNGKQLTLPGIEKRLLEALQQKLEDETLVPLNRPQIIADLLSNSLILSGSKKHVEWMEKLVQLWDRPLPLIQIEAHLFETSETYSRRLGLEFRGQSLKSDGTVLNSDQGPFTAGLAFGSAVSSQGMKVEAILRLLQNEGKGRMLSRPVVVTLNNVEAEMNSGSVLHVKIGTGDDGRLHELKTGVTLRVTPRLIEDRHNQNEDKIWLNIFAEASNPTEGTSIDGIPPINTQRAKTQVFVKNGQPFLLGGLIKNRSGQSQSGVPLFKDLPLIGGLFRTSGSDNRFDHVLVFVTPTRVQLDDKQNLPNFKDMESKKMR